MISLFTYGSLTLPEVIRALTGRDLCSAPAVADDFSRYLLRGRPYPALIRRPGRYTMGRVYFGIDDETLELFDRFEDECYERRIITVRIPFQPGAYCRDDADRAEHGRLSGEDLEGADRDGGWRTLGGSAGADERINVMAYVLPQDRSDLLTDEPWSEARFRAVYLHNYLQVCDEFYRRACAAPSARA